MTAATVGWCLAVSASVLLIDALKQSQSSNNNPPYLKNCAKKRGQISTRIYARILLMATKSVWWRCNMSKESYLNIRHGI